MIRPGGPADADTMLAFLDEAVVWMVARGQSEQWGTEPWSAQPKRVARVRAMAESGLLWMAEADGAPAGALVLGEPPEWIPPVDEPEVYIRFLITSRRLAGRGIGSDLLDFARAHTRAAGIKLLRVDCWAGAEGRLVDYYVRNGFTPTDKFSVDDWQGQVLEQRLD